MKKLLYLFLVITVASCKKDLEIPAPANQVIASAVFQSDATATAATLGIWSKIMSINEYFINGGESLIGGLMSDEIVRTSPSPEYDAYAGNAVVPTGAMNRSNTWIAAYTVIYSANACIEGLTASTGLTPSLKRQLLGEARFARALSYFNLVNLYGDMPLVVSTDVSESQSMARTSSAAIYQQIQQDLYEAQNLLVSAYPVAGIPSRPNKWAATALLARVYLYQQNYTGADSAASAVINSGVYSLVTPIANVFQAKSKEAILQLVPELFAYNTSEGFSFLPQSAGLAPGFMMTNFLLNAFDPADARKLNWVKQTTVGTITYNYAYKYRNTLDFTNPPPTEYNMILRYAEQLLIRAEARAQNNNIGGAQADLNLVRSRAGLPSTTASDKNSMLDAVFKERQLELFCECGHRWFDIKRMGRTAVLASEKPGWKATAALLPIPQAELNLNPALVQNPGY